MQIVEAISRFRAGGCDERIGFTVYDTLRYKRALEDLVKEEVQVLMDRLAGELEPDRAAELIQAGVEPLRDLIAALHQKLLVAELRRQRAARLSLTCTPSRRGCAGRPSGATASARRSTASCCAARRDDAEAGGPVAEVLAGHEGDPLESMLQLRFMGAVHRLALAGRAPALAAVYPSCGGNGDRSRGVACVPRHRGGAPGRSWLSW